MQVNNGQLKNIVSAILFLFLCSILSGQNPMGIVHVGGFNISSYQYNYEDIRVVRGDTLVIYKALLTDREFQVDKTIVRPDGSSQTLSPFYSYTVPTEYGEIDNVNDLKVFKTKDHVFYTIATEQRLLIFKEQAEHFFLHDIDTTPIEVENSHLFAIHVQDENFAYFTIRQYPQIDINFKTCRINLNNNQIENLIEILPDNQQTPLSFQAIGDYTLAYQIHEDSGHDYLIHNGSIVQTIEGTWGLFTAGYQNVQNFSNHYYFMNEIDGLMYQKSLIAWIENDSLKRRVFSSSVMQGDASDSFNGIRSIDEQHFLTHFDSEIPVNNEFRTYQINLLNNLNLFEEYSMFPDLSAYGQALSLISMNEDFAVALSRVNNTDIHFNLVDFSDQSIRTYPFTFDQSSSNTFGEIFSSEQYIYIVNGQRVNVFKLEQTQQNDDPSILPVIQLTDVYPNPFQHSCQIRIKSSLNTASNIAIYNIKGQKIKAFNCEINKNTENVVTWDGKNSENQTVSAGIYFVKVISDQQETTKKILKIK